MDKKLRKFNPNELLPENIVISSEGTHLYRIGLSHFPNGFIRRTKFNNPILILIMFLQFIIRSIISLLLSDEDSNLLVLVGDSMHFMGLRIHLNITIFLTTSLVLISQILHYYNYKNNIKPSYLKPFQMISGLISPKSIGLTNRAEVYRIIKVSKISFLVCEWYSNFVMPLLSFIVYIVSFGQNISFEKFIILGIPHSFLLCITTIYIYRFILWQLIYFYIICYYLKSKLRVINERLKQNDRVINLYKIINSLNSIYSEINDYNNNYWSKFLFWVWTFLTLLINTLLYASLFGRMALALRIFFIVAVTFFVFGFIFIINTVSSINFEANKSYKLLNTSFVCLSGKTLSKYRMIKVNILFLELYIVFYFYKFIVDVIH